MRRSRAITLTLSAAGLTLLAGCGRDPVPNDTVFPSIQACTEAFGSGALDMCTETFANARSSHEQSAPRYASRQECREATGADCVMLDTPATASAQSPWASGGAAAAAQVFIPAMAGVLIGRAMADGSRGMMPVYSGMSPQSQECTREREQRGECRRASGGGTSWFYSGSSGYVGSASPGSSSSGARTYSGFSATPAAQTNLAAGARAASAARTAGVSAPASASRSGGLGTSGMARGGASVGS